ncbi:MAG TPA: hypothetical protein VJO32_15755 [Ktedonobacteraceae bacterium]|nr:hypothetical protein [Ktedonobacteraceae bacterium]
MVVQLHALNWDVYAERVMPAFEDWLIEGDESDARELFEQTRCAFEERFLPETVQRLRVWPRARAFAQTLPRGPYSRREYHKLCSAEHFTALSDRYLYKHAPQLYQQSDALRSVWGAIVETFCLPWGTHSPPEQQVTDVSAIQVPVPQPQSEEDVVERSELVSFLKQAGLSELAQEVSIQPAEIDYFEPMPIMTEEAAGQTDTAQLAPETPAPDGDEDMEIIVAARGMLIGNSPNLLHMRGWLAGISVRAMALFEFLACGRRSMPFGFEAGEPFGAFTGYLTPEEVALLATSLEGVSAPDQLEAEEDHITFRYQHLGLPPALRLVDEVLPTHAGGLLEAIQKAASEGYGLICSVE